MNPGFQQRREVRRGKSIKAIRMRFGGTVATIQAVVKEQAHFINREVGGHVQGIEQVDLPVGTQLRQGDLRAGHDHRFTEVFQHERERRGGKRHGVGAMQDHETIILIVVRLDVVGDMLPVFRGHVGRVHQRVILVNGEIRHLRAMELRH